jgi:hypothetical protein
MNSVVANHVRYVDALIRCVSVPPTATVARDPRGMFAVETLRASLRGREVLYPLRSGGEFPLTDIDLEAELLATAENGGAEDA